MEITEPISRPISPYLHPQTASRSRICGPQPGVLIHAGPQIENIAPTIYGESL